MDLVCYDTIIASDCAYLQYQIAPLSFRAEMRDGDREGTGRRGRCRFAVAASTCAAIVRGQGNGWSDGRDDERIDERSNGRGDGSYAGRSDRLMKWRMDRCINGSMGGGRSMDRGIEGEMDGWMGQLIKRGRGNEMRMEWMME